VLAALVASGAADGFGPVTLSFAVLRVTGSAGRLGPVTVLGPSLAQRYLGGAAAWGVISAGLALGAVVGQLAAGRVRPPARPGVAIACLLPVMTAEALALELGAPLGFVTAAAALTGLAMGVQAVLFQTAMQTSVRPEVLARVAAIDLVGSEGGPPVGYALAAFAFRPALRAEVR
jgi:hypothetical protein